MVVATYYNEHLKKMIRIVKETKCTMMAICSPLQLALVQRGARGQHTRDRDLHGAAASQSKPRVNANTRICLLHNNYSCVPCWVPVNGIRITCSHGLTQTLNHKVSCVSSATDTRDDTEI